MRHQRTICRDVEIEGRGLFTGEQVKMRLRPGAAYEGISFIRVDQTPAIRIAARFENVSKRARRTALKNGSVAIETVEHCLGACAGLSIDNVRIELTGNEIPGMDGSCLPLVRRLQEAGVQEQEAIRDEFVVTDVVRVVEGDTELVALPPLDSTVQHLEITYELDYGPDSPIGPQLYRATITPESFARDIAPARTFVLEFEAEQLRASGLGAHLDYRDIVVFGKDGPIDNELRFPDECVRHKILDLVGDLSLLGCPIIGRIHARRSGHALNHELVKELARRQQDEQRSRLVTKEAKLDVHQVQRVLPHRYPFLMIDRIVEMDGTRRAVAIKNVTINEPFFQGHFPGEPIMPGVLIIEALAQLGGVLLSQKLEHKGKMAVLLSLDRVKFRRSVRPGDQLILEVESIRVRATSGHVRGRALVAGDVVAEAEIKFMLTDATSH